ncbi:GLUG motif-containing protein [Vescimonas sanitatis]|uniref:GLUG motif-containing protein n=1 Tax=Vescimonas sanitatis TaxID=3376993 RepID=UPI003B80BA50
MRKRVISWLLTVVMVVSMLPTSVLADTLAADQEQQTQQEQIAPVDTENTVSAGNEETQEQQEQQEPAEEVPVSRSARSGGAALALAEGTVSSAKDFAEMEPGGNYQLTADITVTAPYAKDFTGTFDGNGHTVTLALENEAGECQALFSKIAASGKVQNLGIAGTVTGKKYVGGIAGKNAGSIENCKNTAAIKGASADGRWIGGIAGETSNGSKILNCYNIGTISSDRSGKGVCLGGIAGNAPSAKISNCYNAGQIVTKSTTNYGAIAGYGYGVTVSNCYFIAVDNLKGVYGTETESTPKSAEEMKSPAFAALLGSAFMAKTGDYPALSWETPTAAVTFAIQPENAVLTINGGTYTGSTTVALPAADAPYSYTVSCDGYTTKTGTVTVRNKDNPVADPANVTVTLAEDTSAWVNVTFNVTPTGAALTVKRGDMTVEPQSDGSYKLLKGVEYTYTAVSDDGGYEPAAGTVTPTENSTQTVALKKVQSIEVTKAPTKTEYYKGDAELDLTGMVLTVNYDGTNETRTITDGYDAAGVTFEGFDTSEPAESKSITVSYRGKTASFAIEVKDKLQFSDFFSAISDSVTATNSTSRPFEPVQSEGCLQPASNASSYSPSTITIAAIKNVTVSFDYCGGTGYTDFYVKKGSSQLLASYYSSEWKNFSADLRIGETLTLSYGSSSGLKLKNFTVSPLYTLTIAPNQTDATVTLKDKEGKAVSGSNGVFAVKAAADYTYTVTKKGYEPATGKVTMSAENQTVNVTLVKLPVITLQFTPDDAAVTLKQGNTTVYKESADSEKGKNVYIAAKNTAYTYTATKFGYETATGTISVATTDVNKTVTLTELAKQTVTFNITKPEGVSAEPVVTVKYNGTKVYEGSGTNCTLPAGNYTYTATLDGCDTLSGSFVVQAAKTIGLEFVKSLTFDDFFAGLDGITAENGTRYGFEPVRAAGGNYLHRNDSVSYSNNTATITLKADKSLVLQFDYYGGTYYSSSEYFSVKKGSTEIFKSYNSNEWKTYSVAVAAGDVLTLTYKGYGENSYVDLKNFTVSPVYTVSLNVTGAEDCTVALQDASGAAITGTDGKYAVPAGVYTYTVSKFGYETKTGTIKVEGGDVSKDVALTALTAYQVKFAADPADASVALTHPVGGTIAADENGAYIVYAGETYAYTVAKANYITVSGSFTAAKNDTIKVTLTYAGAGWDGTTKTAPKTENGVYQIGTAAELAWFADAVNGGQRDISAKLTANINLNDKTWTAIGTSSNKFAGTLDGDNYTVSGLVTTGLVGELAEGGVVENLRVNCAIVSTSSLLGGVANSSAGTIRNCMVSGSITFSSNGPNAALAIGGIVGRTTGNSVISGCVSRAVVKDAYDNSTYGTTAPLGGITGYAHGVVENCYFTGTLAVKKTQPNKIIYQKRGGLVGELQANAELKGSYVAGEFAIADESKFGAVVGVVASSATITNCAYLDTIAPQAVAEGSTSGMTARTADYMRTPEFAAEMGMHLDSDNSNGGFPVLPWQGGTPVDNADLKAAAAAANALQLRGMSAADAAKKAKADWYAENVLGLYNLENYNDKADLCEKYGIEEPGEAVTNPHDYFLTALQKHFYKELGLDAENADLLKADASGVYQLRGLTPVSGDPEEEESAQTYTGFLTLPANVTVSVEGEEKTVSLAWTADNALVNTATGALTAPAKDKVTVTLTATLRSGAAAKVKTFKLCLWSENAEKVQTLEDIAAEFTRKNIAVQPLQGVGLYDETNITDAFCRLLREQGYADVADKAEITYVNGSAKANGFDGTKVQYIADNGDITYFTGDGTARQTVQYTGLKFRIAYAGVTKEIILRGTVGRSADAVQQLVESAAESLNWELIRGENTNGATQSEVAGWTLYTVNDRITSNLTLPSGIAGRYDVKVQWGTRNTEWLYITNGTNGTGVGTVNRPLQPADGTALPEKAGKFRLIARVTYDAFDDYTLAHITGDNGVEVYADVLFDATVAPFDSSVTSEMQNALAEKYQGLLRDFVDKTKPVKLDAVSDDMQMPRPALLEEKGIMSDSYNQKVTMVSLTPDVLDFNGYHAMVYRPLPGEEPAEAKYVVTITTRSSGLLLARQEFTFTIAPFEEQELKDAADFMTDALTENAYWNGIRNKNTDKTKVTSDLYPFAEICKNEDGTLKYVRGTVNMTFDGIEADDIPGWYASEKYRTFYSSRPTVIEHELLRVHQPEYNTTVRLDSVLTYTKYAQYWEKFGINGTEETKERYKDFAQFYKQPIHIDLTVSGTTEQNDPNENQTLTVKVKVDGYNKNGHTFTGISDFTFTGKVNEDPTAWDAVKACLDSANYTYTGSGTYIKSITDAAGNTLKEKGDGKSSGWMFGLAVKGGTETLPKTTLDNTYLKDGDTLRLFFTDTYIPLDPTDPTVPGTEVPGFDEAYAGAKAYIQSAVSAPVVSYLFGEWAVLGQARAGVELSDAYIQAYYDKVVAYVKANIGSDGILRKPDDKNTPVITDNERIALALTAIGKDPANVGGKNLLAALQDKDIMKVTDTSYTDINGLVMGLLALNSRNYTSDTSWLVQAILGQQNADGSWSASADRKSVGDVDMTAMALQALAPYYKDGGNETVNTAVEKALNWLSGKYQSGYDSSESCAQVVIALSALNLDANTDARFTKTVEGKTLSVLGNLLQYRVAKNGGFKHQFADKAVNEMATEQALCAMAAYARFTEKANALYDMTDAACAHRFGEWKVTVAATCTKDGVSRRICSICGAVEEKSVPAPGHKFGAWTTTKEPTCTETGTEKRTCSVCSKEETRVIAALGHTPGTEMLADKDGHWNVCKVCHAVVNKTGHTYVNGIQCVCGAVKSEGGTLKRIEVSDTITVPDTLRDNEKLNSVERIKAELQLQITLKNSKGNKDNTVFMDVSLLVFENNEWRPATKEDLTAGKITVLLPYPEAVAAKYGQYNFTVAHMVAMADCGLDVGTVEFPAVTKTPSGLLVTLTGLSPVAISWTESTNHYYYNPTATPDKTDSANTADDSQMVLWLGSAVLAAAAVVVLTRKKRVSK